MSLFLDVKQLQESPSSEIREKIAEKVTSYFNSGIFDDSEIQIANEIIRLLVQDVEIKVREVLSENLKHNEKLPHDVAMLLSKDVISVAEPMLECSPVLNDKDLIDIIRSTQELARLEAIARRDCVSEGVCNELLAASKTQVVSTMIENTTSEVSDKDFEFIIGKYKDDGNIVNQMVSRGGLSPAVVEKLITVVSEKFKDKLMKEYNIDPFTVNRATKETQEKVTLDVMSKADETQERTRDKQIEEIISQRTETMVDHLSQSGKLTYSIIIRALCEGNLRFFELGLSKLAGISYSNAHTLIWDENRRAFQGLYHKAKLPKSMFEAIEVVLKIVKHDIGVEDDLSQTEFRQILSENIVNHGYDQSVPLMNYLLTLVGTNFTTEDYVR